MTPEDEEKLRNFDPHAFAEQIKKESLHVIDLTGKTPVEYTIPPEEEVVGGYTYAQWMQAVNRKVIGLAGVSVDDLGDFNSWDAWHSGNTPAEGAHEVLEENDFPFDEE